MKRPPTGLLLLKGGADTVASWAEGGLTTVRVVPLRDGWTAVVPVTVTSAAPPPYDDPVGVLLARPVPHRLRPCLGVAVVGDQALIAATPARWRAVQRWVAWRPGTGLVRPGGLPTARLSDLVHLSATDPAHSARSAHSAHPAHPAHPARGRHGREVVAALADIVHSPRGDALCVLRDVLDVLGLPGGDLLGDNEVGAPPAADGPSARPGTHLVEPSTSRVAAFIRMVGEDASWREETGERS